jgi:hypothetical protein
MVSLSCSPDLEIERDDAGDGASKRDGSFTGKGFAQHLNGPGSGAAVDDVDLGKRNVGEFLVVPEKSGSGNEEANIKAVIAALAIQERDELIETSGATACTGEGETAGGAIQEISVADEDAESGAAGNLLGNADGGFLNAGGAAIGTKKDANTKRFAGGGFALFEPGALDGEGLAAGNAFDAERNAVDFGRLEGIDEEACKNILHG